VELHNFNPNSIAQAAIFAAVCEGFLGIDPHWDLWIHLFSAEFFVASTDMKKVRMVVRAGGCTLQLRSGRVAQYIPASLVSSNKGWQNRWFYIRNDDGMLPPFSQRVVTAAGNNWCWGATRENQEMLQPILHALQKLQAAGLTAAGVVAAIHHRRVLPLAERRLRLSEMKPGVDLEGSRMSSTSLSADDLLRRVAGTVGRLDAGALSQPPMRTDRGVCVPGKCPVLLLLCAEFFTFLALTVRIFVRPQGLRSFKLSLPPVPEDAADRTARRLAAEKDKEKKDAEKARARERMRAREALEKRRRRQARYGLPLESSPDTPDDDDDDDDMAARLGFSPDPRLGQGSPSQPPGGLAPPVFGARPSGSRSEERRRGEGVLDPLAEIIGVTPGGQAEPHVPQEQVPAPAVQEVGPSAVVTTPRQVAPSAPRASEVEAASKPAAGQPSAAPAETGA
jgi:hypothetical protein